MSPTVTAEEAPAARAAEEAPAAAEAEEALAAAAEVLATAEGAPAKAMAETCGDCARPAAELKSVGAVRPLLAMLDELSPAALSELERILSARLHVELAPAAERDQRLGALIELLRSQGQKGHSQGRPGGKSPTREAYDEGRPAGSPSSRRLVEIHGSWVRACRAAVSEAEQRGIKLGPLPVQLRAARAWANPTRSNRRPPAYTRDEIELAILACAAEIGRMPTSNAYYDWAALKRRLARQRGTPPPRIPTQRSVERHFASWEEAREAAEARLAGR